jgi:hypothetical protein
VSRAEHIHTDAAVPQVVGPSPRKGTNRSFGGTVNSSKGINWPLIHPGEGGGARSRVVRMDIVGRGSQSEVHRAKAGHYRTVCGTRLGMRLPRSRYCQCNS